MGKLLLKIFLASLALFVLVFFLVFGRALFQEGNPVPIFKAIIKLELTKADIVPIDGNDSLLIQKAGIGDGDNPLSEHLSQSGWELIDWLGSMRTYDKEGEATLIVYTRMFSRRYIIHEMNNN